MAVVSISSGCWFHHWKMEPDWTTRCGPCRRRHKGFFSSSNFISRESIEDVSQSYQTIFIFKRGKKKQLGQPSRCVVEVSVPNMGTLPKSTYLCVGGSLWVQQGEYASAEWIKVEKKWSCRLDWI